MTCFAISIFSGINGFAFSQHSRNEGDGRPLAFLNLPGRIDQQVHAEGIWAQQLVKFAAALKSRQVAIGDNHQIHIAVLVGVPTSMRPEQDDLLGISSFAKAPRDFLYVMLINHKRNITPGADVFN